MRGRCLEMLIEHEGCTQRAAGGRRLLHRSSRARRVRGEPTDPERGVPPRLFGRIGVARSWHAPRSPRPSMFDEHFHSGSWRAGLTGRLIEGSPASRPYRAASSRISADHELVRGLLGRALDAPPGGAPRRWRFADLRTELLAHLAAEEEVLLAAVVETGAAASAFEARFLSGVRSIRAGLANLDTADAQGQDWERTLIGLVTSVLAHFRDIEQGLCPYLARSGRLLAVEARFDREKRDFRRVYTPQDI